MNKIDKLDQLPTRERVAPPRHGARIRLAERRPDKAARVTQSLRTARYGSEVR